jgi:spermidine synthase
MEAKRTIRMQRITLAEIVGNVEVLNRKQLRQIKGGDNDPITPIKK